jgi:predicted ester cyclase
MSLESNKEIVRRVLEEFWHNGDEGVLDELFATDYINHELSNPEVSGLENFKQWARGIRSAWGGAMPDWRVTIEDLVAEGDKVAKRWVFRGTHTGDLFGVAPTGRQVEMRAMTLYHIVDGKVREIHWNFDLYGLLQQIGAIAVPAGTA